MASEDERYLSADLGASGGTICAGRIDDDELTITEVSRFDNAPIEAGDRIVWDIPGLVEKVRDGIARCVSECGPVDSVGVDAWGTDFGFVADNDLVRLPYSYRDPALRSTRSELFRTIGKEALFDSTGIAHWDAATTLYHYHYVHREAPDIVDRADHLLMMPQLISFLLGGEVSCEETVASTTQFLDPRTREWATDLLDRVGVPADLLPPVEPIGRTIGTVDVDIDDPPDIVLPASHDTAAAVAALPLDDEDRRFLSAGTTLVAGIELQSPEQSGRALAVGASNELGIDGTVRFLRNINGFFLLEQCRSAWQSADEPAAYDALMERAAAVEPCGPFVDPNAGVFEEPGDMPAKIRSYCRETDQEPPDSVGETVRCVVESLALKTAVVLEELHSVTDDFGGCIHIGGGATRNELFCQLVANATGRRVVAGPIEATTVGNIVSQAMASGEVESLQAGRELVAESFAFTTYRPDPDPRWQRAKDRFMTLSHEHETP